MGRMKESAKLIRDAMKTLDDEKVSETQKAAAEMLTAHTIDLMMRKDKLSAREIKHLSTATKYCTQIAIVADKYVREQVKRKVESAAKKIDQIGTKKRISPETLKAIREQVYGIIDTHLGIAQPGSGKPAQ